MFKCQYSLDGECQLYSEPCRSVETKKCKLYLDCKSCKFEYNLSKSTPCQECFSLHKKKKDGS